MDAGNDVYYSSASVWETTIKYMSKSDKIQLSGSKLSELRRKKGYQMLPITDKHVGVLETLVFYNESCVIAV